MMAAGIDMEAQKRGPASKRQRTSATVKKERQATRESIKKNNKQLEANRIKTQRALNDLDLVNAEIDQINSDLRHLTIRIDSLNNASALLTDTIATLDRRLQAMRETYARSVRATRSASNSQLTRLAFLFASQSFTQAYRRMRYLREYSEWQSRQAGEIKKRTAELDSRRTMLDSIRQSQSLAADSLKRARTSLDKHRKSVDRLVKDLKRQDKTLKQLLADNEKRARSLDDELERVIAAEQKAAAEARRKAEAEAKRKAEAEAKRKAEAEAKARAEAEAAAKKKTAEKTADKPATTPTPKPTTPPVAKTPEKKPQTQQPKSALGGTFADHKGNLPFPVTGEARIVRGFGKQQHPQLPKVTINNSGIDIQASKGAKARAVFDGKVSAIFQQQGFNTIVMVRHGEYLTIYANLSKIDVKNGDTVSQGQSIGTIYSNTSDNNRTTLHFEIRHEKDKLNPTQWLKPHQ